MSSDALAQLVFDALRLSLELAAPALFCCFVVALLAGVLQNATAASDASLGFVPKLLAVAALLVLTHATLGVQLQQFSSAMFAHVTEVARSAH